MTVKIMSEDDKKVAAEATQVSLLCICLDPQCDECSVRELSQSLLPEVMFPEPTIEESRSVEQPISRILVRSEYYEIDHAFPEPCKELLLRACHAKVMNDRAIDVLKLDKRTTQTVDVKRTSRVPQRKTTSPSNQTNETNGHMNKRQFTFDPDFETSSPGGPLPRNDFHEDDMEQYLDHTKFPALFPAIEVAHQQPVGRSDDGAPGIRQKRRRQQLRKLVRGNDDLTSGPTQADSNIRSSLTTP